MKYNGLTYLIGEGFSNIFKNKKSTITSIITMVCMMFLFGLFFAIGVNVNYMLEQVQMKQGMNVFIWDETTEEQKIKLETEIKALNGVNTVVFKNKQEALEDMKSRFKNKQELMAGFEGENNIFPASFVVTLTDLNRLDEIQTEIERIGAKIATENRAEEVDLEIEESTIHDSIIKNITSSDNTIKTLITIVSGIRMAIGVIFIVLLFVSIMIISNTIRLTVHARRKEISIMKYVGATNSFIRWPFIVEGIIIGIIAAIITLLIIGLLYDVVIQNIEASKVLQKMSITLLSFSEIAKTISIVYALLGIGIGILGSAMSMKKYLEV
ncbi:MAG: permease-like cell division protein FtsX [Clostridia bacterium]|nr:permease-like cell division protein FtsX [Clostridia bacterium]